MGKDGRRNPVIMRRLDIVTQSIKLPCGKGNRSDRQFLFELAEWLVSKWQSPKNTNRTHTTEVANRPYPRRSLAGYMDENLWGILKRHGQIKDPYIWWDDMPKESLRALEKRLYHYWKSVESLASALKSSTDHASNSRRKKKNPTQHMVSQLMARPNS
jgi:hypothetical protein